jgi:hypothetical protein
MKENNPIFPANKKPPAYKALDVLVSEDVEAPAAARVSAAGKILDRAPGKVPEPGDVTGADQPRCAGNFIGLPAEGCERYVICSKWLVEVSGTGFFRSRAADPRSVKHIEPHRSRSVTAVAMLSRQPTFTCIGKLAATERFSGHSEPECGLILFPLALAQPHSGATPVLVDELDAG